MKQKHVAIGLLSLNMACILQPSQADFWDRVKNALQTSYKQKIAGLDKKVEDLRATNQPPLLPSSNPSATAANPSFWQRIKNSISSAASSVSNWFSQTSPTTKKCIVAGTCVAIVGGAYLAHQKGWLPWQKRSTASEAPEPFSISQNFAGEEFSEQEISNNPLSAFQRIAELANRLINQKNELKSIVNTPNTNLADFDIGKYIELESMVSTLNKAYLPALNTIIAQLQAHTDNQQQIVQDYFQTWPSHLHSKFFRLIQAALDTVNELRNSTETGAEAYD